MYQTWARELADLTDRQIQMGLRKAKDFVGYFSLPAFRELCRISPADLGMPDAMTAMREACNAPFPKDRHSWSHPAVYLAGCAVGWFDMQNKTEKELFPIYDSAYDVLVKRVLAGEPLSMPVPKALPPKVYMPAKQEHARAALSKIRGML